MVLSTIKQLLMGLGVLFICFVLLFIYAETIEPKIREFRNKRSVKRFIKRFNPSVKLREKIDFKSFDYELGLSKFDRDKCIIIAVTQIDGYNLKHIPHYLVYYNKRMLKDKENLQKEIENILEHLVDNMEIIDWKNGSYKLN